jgi:putative flippase GtrA
MDPVPDSSAPGILLQIADVWRFVRTHRPIESYRYLISKEAPFIVQFAKYGCCGLLAFLVHNGTAWWLSRTIFPAFHGLEQQVLARNQIYANLVALGISNVVAYVTNVLWVFTSGRHNRLVEFGLFTLVNAISGLAGIFAGPFLRQHLPIGWVAAQAALVVTSAIINFVCRKFLVFQR